jgi:hypothetical protein
MKKTKKINRSQVLKYRLNKIKSKKDFFMKAKTYLINNPNLEGIVNLKMNLKLKRSKLRFKRTKPKFSSVMFNKMVALKRGKRRW